MSGTNPTVEVLLATYNGATYLRDQVESVLKQIDVEPRILVRDDGSTDGTQAILTELAAAYPDHIRILPADTPTGLARANFARLLRASTGNYVAFCDQDDLWLPTKLQQTLNRMQQLEQQHGSSKPLLVYTDLHVVDAALQPIALSLWQQNGLGNAESPSLGQLLGENTVTGCTALLNRTLADRLKTMPPQALMHDHWAALVAASTGALAGLAQPTVLYRQHSNNVVGATARRSPWTALGRLFNAAAVQDRTTQRARDRAQAEALLQLHAHQMNPAARATVQAFINLHTMSPAARIQTMLRYDLWRSGPSRILADITDALRR